MTPPDDDICDVIRRVAEWLGWEHGEAISGGLTLRLPDPYCWTAIYDIRNQLVIASVVRAELAKWGYQWSTGGGFPQMDGGFWCPDRYDSVLPTDQYGFDPTDPLSEAHAVLRAADDVARMETGGEG